jgi:low temperature requirement protein LtrA
MSHAHAHAHSPRPARPWLASLGARSPDEAHRVATPLELFFDLVVVVAVARAAGELHHALSAGHVAAGVLAYSMTFFGVWWAWVNFTWFASAYDNDDVAYRLLVLLQLTGALILAAGIGEFAHGHRGVAVLGYVVMRLALVIQWLRAARADAQRRRCARRYALGIFVVQSAWVASLWVPDAAGIGVFWALAVCEMLVPVWAERAAATPWHPHHIAERYSLLTLITLGESVLAASNAVESAVTQRSELPQLLPTIIGGLLILFCCWWLYFEREAHELLTTFRATFIWGYGHYFVFGAAAALGAGLSVAVDHALDRAQLSDVAAGAAVTVPTALYLACLWVLHARSEPSMETRVLAPVVITCVLLSSWTPEPVLVTGLLLTLLTARKVAVGARRAGPSG